MASTSDPLVLEKITYYREAEVIAVTSNGGSSLPIKDPAIVGQFLVLLKKLKASEEIAEPLLIGDQAYTLAPSLTIDSISGPVFWEEIVKLES